MSRFMTAFFQPLRFVSQTFNNIAQVAPQCNSLVTPENPLLSLVRTKVRCYFPRPNEVRRVRRHGWKTRMSTHNGRKIIMRRVLNGRHVLSH